jgi:hypothetical protein
MKTLSRSLLTALAVSCVVAAGCWVEPDPAPRPTPAAAPPPAATTPEEPSDAPTVSIETGQTLSAEPGQGAGVFVEYLGSGAWYVWSTCDSAVGPWVCKYRMVATPESGATLSNTTLDPADKNGSNRFAESGNQLDATFTTSYEADGFRFQVDPPGAAVQIELWIDGARDPLLLYWQGPDATHYGAPADPVVFVPTAP